MESTSSWSGKRDQSKPLLPEPWIHVGTVDKSKFDALEEAAGSQYKIKDLSPEEARGEVRSPRSIQALARKWVAIQNVDNDMLVYLRLQGPETSEDLAETVSAVVFPFQPGEKLTGSDLRALPIQALSVAYSKHSADGRANFLRTLALGDVSKENALDPLPPASAEDAFTARVARQYVTIEEELPTLNPIEKMMEINDTAKSSIQRWVTRARKRGFLPPAIQGRRRG